MNKYLNKPETTKTNFKMYKDGKHWVFAGLMLLTVPMALMGSLEVSAAETEKKATSATATSDDEADTIKTASIESPVVNAEKTAEVSEVATEKVSEVTPKSEVTEEKTETNTVATADLLPMLAISKEDARIKINALPNLTAAQKKGFVDSINNLSILDKLPIVGSSPDWFLAQAEATNGVYGNKNLTKADLVQFDAQIATAGKTIPLIGDGYANLKWIEKRAGVMEKVRTTDNLTDADKNDLAERVYRA